MSDKGMIAGTKPVGIDVEAGKDYWWCACGRSKNQPLWDLARGCRRETRRAAASTPSQGDPVWYDVA